jgi:hypothetical protein
LRINVGAARSWRAAGLTDAQFRTAVAGGDLVRVRRGVYASRRFSDAAAADPVLHAVLRVAAVTSAQTIKGAVASHQSAALIHQFSLLNAPAPDLIWLTRAQGSYRGKAMPSVRMHTAALPDRHVSLVRGLPVTSPTRTVVDLARTLPYLEGVAVADSALHSQETSKPQLHAMLSACGGWPGIGTARRVVEFSDGLAESVLESAARVIFARAGLPPPVLQARIMDGRLRFIGRADFCWESQRTVAEADGMAKYDDPARAREQIRRDIRLRDAGYKVVHFTWAELFGDPDAVIRRIRRAFAAPSPY